MFERRRPAGYGGGILTGVALSRILSWLWEIPSSVQNATTWWEWVKEAVTSMTATEHLSIWGPLVIGVLLILYAEWPRILRSWHRRRRPPLDTTPDQAAIAPTPLSDPIEVLGRPSGAAEERVFIQRTPLELFDMISGLTDFAASKQVEPFIGKWLWIKATIHNVSDNGGYITLTLRGHPHVFADFESKYAPHLFHLVSGDRIEFFGMIKKIGGLYIQLSGCEPR